MLLIVNGTVKYFRSTYPEVTYRKITDELQEKFAQFCYEQNIMAANIWYTRHLIFVVTEDNWICECSRWGSFEHYDSKISERIVMFNYAESVDEKILLTTNGSLWISFGRPVQWQSVPLASPVLAVSYINSDRIIRVSDKFDNQRWLSLGIYPQGQAPNMSLCNGYKQFYLEESVLYGLTTDHELYAIAYGDFEFPPSISNNVSSIPKYLKYGGRVLLSKDVMTFVIGKSIIMILTISGEVLQMDKPTSHIVSSRYRSNKWLNTVSVSTIEIADIHTELTTTHSEIITMDIENNVYCITASGIRRVEVDLEDVVVIPNKINTPLGHQLKSARSTH